MKYKILTLLCSTLVLAGCDQVKSRTGGGVSCSNETAKELVVETFSKSVSNSAAERVKGLISEENITIDMGKLRAALK